MQPTSSKQIDLNFTMKSGSIFTVPVTWIIKTHEDYI